jgi:hypothetical protein
LFFKGNIKNPIEVYEEFADTKDKDGNKDPLATWADKQVVKDALLFEEEAEQDLVARITYGGYVPNPIDDQLTKIGRDPFLLSYALKDTENRCIVTTKLQSHHGWVRTDIFLMCVVHSAYVA